LAVLEELTAVCQGITIGPYSDDGWARPYQELVWEIPAQTAEVACSPHALPSERNEEA